MEVTSHLEYRFSSIGHPAVWDNCIAAARSHAMYMSHVIRLRYCTRTRTSGHGLLVCQNSGGILPEVLGLLVLAFWWISKFSARTRTRTLRPNSGSGSGDYPTSGKHWLRRGRACSPGQGRWPEDQTSLPRPGTVSSSLPKIALTMRALVCPNHSPAAHRYLPPAHMKLPLYCTLMKSPYIR